MNSSQPMLHGIRANHARTGRLSGTASIRTPQVVPAPRSIEPTWSDAGVVGLPIWKRLLDLTGVILTAPLWLPVMFFVAVLIKIVSPGPAFFRQERIGYRGRRFICFKFRTMKVNADSGVHQQHLTRLMDSNVPMRKLDSAGDPRLIRFGLMLRSLGLDELPQLLNVLRGDMSLVGPRPCVRYEYEQYDSRARQRFAAVPGLTGLWQVNGKNRTTFQEMIDMDVHYAMNKSLLLDLKILLKTLPAIISQAREVTRDNKSPSESLPQK